MKVQESGLTEIVPLICTLLICSQYPVFSLSEFPQGSPREPAAVCQRLDADTLSFLLEFPQDSPGELQSWWASLQAQMVKTPPVMSETWVQSPGWEDPLEAVMATHSSLLAWRIPMGRGAWWATVHGGHKESDTTEALSIIIVDCDILCWLMWREIFCF